MRYLVYISKISMGKFRVSEQQRNVGFIWDGITKSVTVVDGGFII
jgi:hypothetical protein